MHVATDTQIANYCQYNYVPNERNTNTLQKKWQGIENVEHCGGEPEQVATRATHKETKFHTEIMS